MKTQFTERSERKLLSEFAPLLAFCKNAGGLIEGGRHEEE